MKSSQKERKLMKEYYIKNKEKRKRQMKEYWIKNKKKMKKYKKKYYEENKRYIKNKTKKYQSNNTEKIKIYNKNYWNKNKLVDNSKLLIINRNRNNEWYNKRDKIKYRRKKRIWERNKREKDIVYANKRRLRGRLNQALKSFSINKEKKSNEYGIDFKAIIDYLGPCPGKRCLYNIDHKKSLCLFDYNNPKEIKKSFNPKNHQWLTIEEHKIKTAKECKKRMLESDKKKRFHSITHSDGTTNKK